MLDFSHLGKFDREYFRLLCVKKQTVRASFVCMTLKSMNSALFVYTDMGKIELSLWRARIMTEE